MLIQRIRVRFSKKGELRAISHLDLMRAFERALRRAGLPLRMSEGFNPRPRISFPAPLGVGMEGSDEVMEFDLAEWAHLPEVAERLREQLPDGIELLALDVGDPHKAARAEEVTYRILPHDALRGDRRLGAQALEGLLARDEVLARRIRKGREKVVNIRPFVLSLRWDGEELVARLKAGPEGSTRPEEILEATGIEAEACRSQFRITRTRVQLAP